MTEQPYEIALTPPARRAITEELPEAVAAPVIWSARRGTYRVLYRICEDSPEVVILRIDHRRDACRSLT